MKTNHILFTLAALVGAANLTAADKVAGPKGGRLLETAPPVEFLLTPERKVEITFYDAALKPVAPRDQVVTVTAEAKSGKTPIELRKTTTGFVSNAAVPAGDPYRVVVQVRERADARPKNFRLDLNTAECGECKRAEYACTCEGH